MDLRIQMSQRKPHRFANLMKLSHVRKNLPISVQILKKIVIDSTVHGTLKIGVLGEIHLVASVSSTIFGTRVCTFGVT